MPSSILILDEIKKIIFFFTGFGPNSNGVPVVPCTVPPKTAAVYLTAAAIKHDDIKLNWEESAMQLPHHKAFWEI